MINTVIFDMDGLLIDSEYVTYQIYIDILSRYNCYFTLEQYIQNYCGRDGIKNMIQLIENFNLPISVEQGRQIKFDLEKEYLQKGIDLKPGALELLKYLKQNNYKILLATSSRRSRGMEILSFHHIEDYFMEMVFGAELERGKPYPDIFLKAAEKANASVEQCLVLEDSPAGIQAAYSGNIKVICIPDCLKPKDEQIAMCEMVANSLFDVIDYLEKNN